MNRRIAFDQCSSLYIVNTLNLFIEVIDEIRQIEGKMRLKKVGKRFRKIHVFCEFYQFLVSHQTRLHRVVNSGMIDNLAGIGLKYSTIFMLVLASAESEIESVDH